MKKKSLPNNVKRFLRERKLLKSYKRFQKIKRSRKIKVSVDGESKILLVYKEKGRTILANPYTLEKLATTKRYNIKNIEQGFKEKLTLKQGKKTKTTPIKLKIIKKTYYDKTIHTERSFPLRKAIGKIFLSATFYGSRGIKTTTEGGSQTLRLLSSNTEREKSFEEAFRGAWGQVNFSPQDWVINWIHYNYVRPKKGHAVRIE